MIIIYTDFSWGSMRARVCRWVFFSLSLLLLFNTFNSSAIAYLKRYEYIHLHAFMYEICLSALTTPPKTHEQKRKEKRKLFGYEFLWMAVAGMYGVGGGGSGSIRFTCVPRLSLSRGVDARGVRNVCLCIFLPFNFPVAFSEIYFNVFVSRAVGEVFVWLFFIINVLLSFHAVFLISG